VDIRITHRVHQLLTVGVHNNITLKQQTRKKRRHNP
jgi:hypothetical protein